MFIFSHAPYAVKKSQQRFQPLRSDEVRSHDVLLAHD
jgi:hypothetical protein